VLQIPHPVGLFVMYAAAYVMQDVVLVSTQKKLKGTFHQIKFAEIYVNGLVLLRTFDARLLNF
jgi:hypothetical protein